jgi:ribosomal protein S27E
MSTPNYNANQYEIGGHSYQYIYDISNGPTYMYKCKDCDNHCAMTWIDSSHKYHCASCGEFWLSKGLAPYKVIEMEIPEAALGDA